MSGDQGGSPNKAYSPSTQNSALTHHSSLHPAFTLIEMMVVVGILALLISIVVPVTANLLDRSKRNQTLATMKVLEQAIASYKTDAQMPVAPLRAGPAGWSVGNLDEYNRSSSIFGPLPPTPTARFAPNPLAMQNVAPSAQGAVGGEGDAETQLKFTQLIFIITRGWKHAWQDPNSGVWTVAPKLPTPPPQSVYKDGKDRPSIECLMLALTQLSPGARKIIANLPGQVAQVNDDRDVAFKDLNDSYTRENNETQDVNLFEVLDAWKHPLRYSVQEPERNATTGDVISLKVFVWELRSAGPDGVMAEPFSSEDSSDDVVLKGT